MATRFVFLPNAAEFPNANFPQLQTIHSTARRPVLAFDAGTDESCYWTFVAPVGLTTPVTARIYYVMASATANGVVFNSALECVTDGDTTDLDAAESFDTDNSSGAVTVPGTAGHIDVISITLSNNDSITPGDLCRLRLSRNADDGSDNATGDCLVLAAELRDAT